MLVTICTDASYDHATGISGWAAWITTQNERIKCYGIFKEKCDSSDDAESKAILNAIVITLRKVYSIEKIIVNTDSRNSINIFNGNIPRFAKESTRILAKNKVDIFKRIIKNIDIEFRHVKAHTGFNNRRSWVNEWCDGKAKSAMRNARKGRIVDNNIVVIKNM